MSCLPYKPTFFEPCFSPFFITPEKKQPLPPRRSSAIASDGDSPAEVQLPQLKSAPGAEQAPRCPPLTFVAFSPWFAHVYRKGLIFSRRVVPIELHVPLFFLLARDRADLKVSESKSPTIICGCRLRSAITKILTSFEFPSSAVARAESLMSS